MKAINLTKTAGSAQCHSQNQKSFGRFSDSMRGIAVMSQSRKSLVLARSTKSAPVIASVVPAKTSSPDKTVPGSSSTVLAVILGGGAGTRLYPLTKNRAKPAVPIGGAYRLIDVPMSNCINSGINKIYILTQFNSTSLNRHLARTYNFGASGVRGGENFVEVLAATQTPDSKDWFQGTADAMRQYAWLFKDAKNRKIEEVVILSGDHLYRMDYMKFVEHHRATKADITIGCLPMDDGRASDFGLMKINDEGRITEFSEKPKGDALKAMQVDTTILGLSAADAKIQKYIASMGIYVFSKNMMLKLLEDDPTQNDFGGEIIPAAAQTNRVMAYLFDDYWEDIGTIKSFFDSNLALTENNAKFEFYDPNFPVYTSPRFLPPAKVVGSKLKDAIVSHGAYLNQCTVDRSIIGLRSRINAGVSIKNSLLMGADYYESDQQRAALLANGQVPIGIGSNTHLENVIADKNCRIGENCVITNKDNVQEAEREAEGYYIRSGIVVLLRNQTIKNDTII